jgi:hypothetical protein
MQLPDLDGFCDSGWGTHGKHRQPNDNCIVPAARDARLSSFHAFFGRLRFLRNLDVFFATVNDERVVFSQG